MGDMTFSLSQFSHNRNLAVFIMNLLLQALQEMTVWEGTYLSWNKLTKFLLSSSKRYCPLKGTGPDFLLSAKLEYTYTSLYIS